MIIKLHVLITLDNTLVANGPVIVDMKLVDESVGKIIITTNIQISFI